MTIEQAEIVLKAFPESEAIQRQRIIVNLDTSHLSVDHSGLTCPLPQGASAYPLDPPAKVSFKIQRREGLACLRVQLTEKELADLDESSFRSLIIQMLDKAAPIRSFVYPGQDHVLYKRVSNVSLTDGYEFRLVSYSDWENV